MNKTRKSTRTTANHKYAIGTLVSIETGLYGTQLARITTRVPSEAGNELYCVQFISLGIRDRYDVTEMTVVEHITTAARAQQDATREAKRDGGDIVSGKYVYWTLQQRDAMPCVVIYSKDYREPLWGDYRGVEMAVIRYNTSDPASQVRAEQLAKAFIKAIPPLVIEYGEWDDEYSEPDDNHILAGGV